MRALRSETRSPTENTQLFDPAPSRLRYRVQRWMLTPGIRSCLRYGVPMLAVALMVGGYFSDEMRRKAVSDTFQDLRASFEQRPEFLVNVMAVDGASAEVSGDVREVLSLDFPISSFDLDLETVRARVMELDPVKTASVRIRPGGILQVDVVERSPAVVWRNREGLALLDETGAFVAELGQRGLHPSLPLVVGEGAQDAVPEALRLIRTAHPLGSRLRGLVRQGGRRWDVVLDRNQRILLPAKSPVVALERALAVSEAQDLLNRDVAAVDMRIAARLTVRMTEAAVEDRWRIKQLNSSGN